MYALAFGLPHPGLRLRHRLVLKRIHAGKTPHRLLIQLDRGLRTLTRRILGIEGGETGKETGARIHAGSVPWRGCGRKPLTCRSPKASQRPDSPL